MAYGTHKQVFIAQCSAFLERVYWEHFK